MFQTTNQQFYVERKRRRAQPGSAHHCNVPPAARHCPPCSEEGGERAAMSPQNVARNHDSWNVSYFGKLTWCKTGRQNGPEWACLKIPLNRIPGLIIIFPYVPHWIAFLGITSFLGKPMCDRNNALRVTKTGQMPAQHISNTNQWMILVLLGCSTILSKHLCLGIERDPARLQVKRIPQRHSTLRGKRGKPGKRGKRGKTETKAKRIGNCNCWRIS